MVWYTWSAEFNSFEANVGLIDFNSIFIFIFCNNDNEVLTFN